MRLIDEIKEFYDFIGPLGLLLAVLFSISVGALTYVLIELTK